MIDDPHPSHLTADSFQHPGAEVIFTAKWRQRRQESCRWVFQLDKDGQKYPLVATITGKQDFCQFIQSLDPGNFIAIKLDLCAWNIFHPCVFDENLDFLDEKDFLAMLKFFRDYAVITEKIIFYRKPCDSVAMVCSRPLWTSNDILGCVKYPILLEYTHNS